MITLNTKNNHSHDTTDFNDDIDVLAIYLNEINKIPLLSREDEIRIAQEAKSGSQEAKKKLVEANLRYVVMVAKRYQHRGLLLEDLISEGNFGLLSAAEKYDSDRGYHFITYATWWIRQSILKAIGQKSTMIRLPLNRAQELHKIMKAKEEIRKNKGEAANIDEISSYCGLDRDETTTLINFPRKVGSLDTTLSAEDMGNTIAFLIEDNINSNPETIILQQSLQDSIERALSSLNLKERDVIAHRFGLGGMKSHTLKEVGNKYQLTKERIRQIENNALVKLRTKTRRQNLEPYMVQ
jgi:RNA polymerase primary sigma factor